LGFAVNVAVPFVEQVRAIADNIGANGHALAALGASPFFGGLEEPCTCAVTTMALRYDETVYLRAKRDFKEWSDADMNPADDESIYLGEEHGVLRGWFQAR